MTNYWILKMTSCYVLMSAILLLMSPVGLRLLYKDGKSSVSKDSARHLVTLGI